MKHEKNRDACSRLPFCPYGTNHTIVSVYARPISLQIGSPFGVGKKWGSAGASCLHGVHPRTPLGSMVGFATLVDLIFDFWTGYVRSTRPLFRMVPPAVTVAWLLATSAVASSETASTPQGVRSCDGCVESRQTRPVCCNSCTYIYVQRGTHVCPDWNLQHYIVPNLSLVGVCALKVPWVIWTTRSW